MNSATNAAMKTSLLDADRRRALGEFIRAHRERVRPTGAIGRRRTPGLRREELASLAGISATWCTWLEQGREVQASPQALGRLAKALALSRAERAYLFDLAARRDPDLVAPGAPREDAPPSLLAAVQALRHPAYALDPLWNACCWNAPAARLFVGWLDADHQRNLLRFVFLDDAARRLIPGWKERAQRLLAEFRADYAKGLRDARVRSLVDELREASEPFASAWEAQDVQDRSGGLRTFQQAGGGRLRFMQHTFHPADRPDYKLVMLVPEAATPAASRSADRASAPSSRRDTSSSPPRPRRSPR